MNKYSSEYNVDFSKNFIFDFEISELLDETNFYLKFNIENINEIEITNISDENYILNADESYSLLMGQSNCMYFTDEILYVENEPYKKVITTDSSEIAKNFFIKNNKTYILTDKFSNYSEGNNKFIKRINDIDDNGNYIQPFIINQYENNAKKTFFKFNKNNFLKIEKNKKFRLSVTENGTLINLWEFNEKFPQLIESFKFSNSIKNGKIKLEINNAKILKNLNFSFFEAQIK